MEFGISSRVDVIFVLWKTSSSVSTLILTRTRQTHILITCPPPPELLTRHKNSAASNMSESSHRVFGVYFNAFVQKNKQWMLFWPCDCSEWNRIDVDGVTLASALSCWESGGLHETNHYGDDRTQQETIRQTKSLNLSRDFNVVGPSSKERYRIYSLTVYLFRGREYFWVAWLSSCFAFVGL